MRPLQVQNLMTACIIIVAAYYSSIALVTTHIQAPQDTKNKIWCASGTEKKVSVAGTYSWLAG